MQNTASSVSCTNKTLRMFNKSVKTTFLYFFTIQLLLYSIVDGDSVGTTKTPSGAEFLQNVIGNLQRPKLRKVFNDRIDVEEYIPNDIPYNAQAEELKILSKQPLNFNDFQKANHPTVPSNNPPDNQGGPEILQFVPEYLKNELAKLEQQSATQEYPVQFSPLPSNSITKNIVDAISGDQKHPDGTIPGYNYYFYPLDNNMLQQMQNGLRPLAPGPVFIPNGDLDAMNSENGGGQVAKPRVEPLFVAMAGFVGVAVVFLSAMMFIPRLPIPALTSKGVLKRAPEELATLTKLVTESIDGKDCSERIACEVGRAMRSMKVGSKPIRMMEIILPPEVAKQLAQIRRSASKKEECHFIMCKKTEGTLKLVAKLKKTNNNKTLNDVKEIFNIK